MNLIPFNAQVAAIVSRDDVMPNISPLSRGIELLVDVTIEPEGRFANSSVKNEVLEPIFERPESS
jgi:hypothetical protein